MDKKYGRSSSFSNSELTVRKANFDRNIKRDAHI